MLRILIKDESGKLGIIEADGVFQGNINISTLYFYRIRDSDFGASFIKVKCDDSFECTTILYNLLENGYIDLATLCYEHVEDEREVK